MARLRALLLSFRPPELVLAAFLLYLGAKVALAGHASFAEAERPRAELLAAVLVVVALRLGLRFLRAPWPEALSDGLGRLHQALGALSALPLLLELYQLSELDWSDWGSGEGDALWHVSLTLTGVATELALRALPLPLLWLGLGLHLKAHAGLRPGALAREAGAGLLDVARDWLPPVLLIFAYRWMGLVLNGYGTAQIVDARLAAADRWLFGVDPVAWLQAHASRPALEWLTFCYGFYFPLYPLCLGALYALRERTGFRELATALCLALACGYVGYTLVPAEGPAYYQHLVPNLNHVYFKAIEEGIVDRNRIRLDCFPSLHTATSLTLLWGAWRHRRGLFWALLPVVVSIPFACVFLGYHYVVDILAGLTLAAAVTRVAPRWVAAQAAHPQKQSGLSLSAQPAPSDQLGG